jgi:hypothetical protein
MYRSAHPLSNDQIARYAPSVFTEAAHGSRSDRYTHISTARVLDGLRNEGFMPMAVGQTRTRDASKREFTKHLMRFRHNSSLQGGLVVGQEVPELVLVNSHDGASAYSLMGGIYRLVCSNGMVVSSGAESEVKVRHSGDTLSNVIEGSFEVIEGLKRVIPVIDDWKQLQLTYEQRKAYAEAALGLRWDAEQAPISATSLLNTRRHEDRKDDLFTTFNKVQENLIRGGLRGEGSTGRRMTTRAVASVTENVKLNKALWQLTAKMAELAAA